MTGIKGVNLVDEKKGRQMVKDRRLVVSFERGSRVVRYSHLVRLGWLDCIIMLTTLEFSLLIFSIVSYRIRSVKYKLRY